MVIHTQTEVVVRGIRKEGVRRLIPGKLVLSVAAYDDRAARGGGQSLVVSGCTGRSTCVERTT